MLCCVVRAADLEHDGPLLLGVDGEVGAGHPGVGAQVSQTHVRVPASQQSVDAPIYQPADISVFYMVSSFL